MSIMEYLGRDIVVEDNVISAEICTALIAFFEANNQLRKMNNKAAGNYTSDTQYLSCSIVTKAAPKLDRLVKSSLASSLNKYVQLLKIPFHCGDIFEPLKIMKFRKFTDKFDTHFDASGDEHYRQLAFIWYLNDVEKGGELQLPSINEHITISPKQGRLVIVPTGWTHYHYVVPPLSEDRYSLITFLRFKK